MLKYTISCKECKRKRVYEAQTFGEALEKAKDDGWRATREMTYRVCRECKKGASA